MAGRNLAYAASVGYSGASSTVAGILYSQGTTFLTGAATSTEQGIAGIAVADVDRNGYLDMILPCAAEVVVEYGQAGGGLVRTGYSTGTSAGRRVGAADFNRDGYNDIAVLTDSSSTSVSMFYGGPSGLGTMTGVYSAQAPKDLLLADIDGDGRLDIALGTGPAGSEALTVLYGTQAGGFSSTAYPMAKPLALVAGDFTSDNRCDLAMVRADGVALLAGLSGGGFAPAETYALPFTPGDLAAGDFNGDGRLDLVVTSTNTPDYAVLYNQVPEPLSLTLLGLGGMALLRRR